MRRVVRGDGAPGKTGVTGNAEPRTYLWAILVRDRDRWSWNVLYIEPLN